MVPTTLSSASARCSDPVGSGSNSHPDAVSEASLNLPRRIDDPTSAAQLTRDLLRNHREDITMALYLDDRHRLVGTAILTIGWVQAARLSARPILFGTRRASPAPASSSATAATGLRAPPKARNAPSVPSPQHAAGTALSWPITWWWSADGGISSAFLGGP